MRNSIIYSLLLSIFFLSCRKEDNTKLPDLTRVPTPLVTKVTTTDQVISVQDPTVFKGSFTVDLFFKDDVPPQKFDIVVMKNGDKGNVKTIHENITTFPSSFEITGPQLATLFGAAIQLGDKFDVGVDVTTQSGQKFQAFPLIGAGYGAGVGNQEGASTFIRYEAVCKFDAAAYAGNFEVITDEWEDYGAGEVIPVTVINETQLSFKYKAANAQPIIVTVNPNTNSVSVAKQVYGTYAGTPYGNFSVESIPNVENFVAPCEGVLSVILRHTVSAGSFGEYKIVLKKKS